MFRYRLIRLAMQIVRLSLMARFKVNGRENIPAQGPYIIILNHTSVVDTPVLLINFPLQKWRFFAVDKWRTHPIYGPIMAWLGAIYIERDTVDRSQLRAALEALEAGTVFGLAPGRIAQLYRADDGRQRWCCLIGFAGWCTYFTGWFGE